MKKTPDCPICHSNQTHFFCIKDNQILARCKVCSHLFVRDPISTEELTQYYANRKSHHASIDKEKWDFSNFKSLYVYKPLLNKIDQTTNLIHGTLLDIGCSNGSFIKAACDFGWAAEGIELEKDSYEVCKKYNLNVYNKDLISLQLAENSYDVITMWQVIEHLSQPEIIIKECYRILKSNGILAISTPNISSIAWHLLKEKWGVVEPHVHLHLFSPKSLKILLQENGFEIKRFETLDIKPSTIKALLNIIRKQKLNKQDKSFAKFTQTKTERQMKNLLMFRKILNLPLNYLSWGEDIYGFFRKP